MDVNWKKILSPLDIKKLLWPGVQFYSREREIIYSVADCPETVVVAGNGLGVWPPPEEKMIRRGQRARISPAVL